MMDLDQRLAVEVTLYRYCDAVDRVDTAALVELFTNDAVLDYGFGRVFEGRTAIIDLLSDRLSTYAATSHHLSNVLIDFEGPTANVTSAIYAFHQDAESGEQRHVWGRYLDRLHRDEDGRWRIAHRAIRAAGERGFEPAAGQLRAFEPLSSQARR